MDDVAQTCLIALGGNMPSAHGGPDVTLRAALVRLQELLDVNLRVSALYQTPCFPAGVGPDYVNAAASFCSKDSPDRVLEMLHLVEAEFGRERVQRWGQRSLDLDLIALGQTICPDRVTQDQWRTLPPAQQVKQTPDQLVLPHPRLQDRAFVLVPLADIAPDWEHPILKLTVKDMVRALPSDAVHDVVAI